MELARRYLGTHASRFEGYLALQRALMMRHVARGGTTEDFCARLAPAFRRKYAGMLSAPGLHDLCDRAA